ncbi:hypothetical protein [Halalkalibacter lacteus]|uniref:hypothetical protein n=1 Tax=Halalkalibacter lacteus TaxID=3090663 RepID=UPI002FCA0AF0
MGNDSYDQIRSNLPPNKQDERIKKCRVRKPWYNKGWIWLIVAIIGIAVLFFGLSGITEEIANMNESIQAQTASIDEQNQVLQFLKEGMKDLTVAIQEAISTFEDSINDSA